MRIPAQLNKHRAYGILAMTLGLSLPIIYILWVLFHWFSILIVTLIPFAVLIYIANFDHVSIPYLNQLLTRHYFKAKFRVTELQNKIGKDGISQVLKLLLNLAFLKIIYFLILLFKSSEESFNEIREEIQRNTKEIAVVDVRYDVIYDIEYIEKKIENGEQIDHDILVEFYQKLFDMHKRQKGRAAKLSLSGLVLLIISTVISGTITSLIFNKTPNIFAATYNFVQSSWAGGSDGGSMADHTNNQSGWIQYSASSSGLIIGTDLSLATSSFWFKDDGATSTNSGIAVGGGFANGTNASTTVSGTGVNASLVLASQVGNKNVSAGDIMSCSVRTGGTVFCWGQNSAGQLGDNTNNQRNVPVQVLGVGGSGYLTDISQVAAGFRHACALKTDGTVFCWGQNNTGQLGDNTNTQRNAPVQVLGVGGSGYLTGIIQISAGVAHTCALKNDGTAYCWGQNTFWQLGDNTNTQRNAPVQVLGVGGSGYLSNVSHISAGSVHTCAAKTDGTAYCWGTNSSGQLGDNTTTPRGAPIQVLGVGGSGNLTGVEEVGASLLYGMVSGSTCARKIDGTVFCWGDNYYGQLGNGTTTQSKIPVQVLDTDGVGNLSNIMQISVGAVYACAVKNDNTAYCWGRDNYSQLGNPVSLQSNIPVQVYGEGGSGFLLNIESISAGATDTNYNYMHTCAIKTDGNTYCWGNNSNGQVGDNTILSKNYPTLVHGVNNSGYFNAVAYKSSGTFTSAVIDMGGVADFTILGFSASTSASTTIQIDIRAGNTATPDGTWTIWQTGIVNGGNISALNGKRYVQYRSGLSTTNDFNSSALNDITINNTQYITSANLTSSIYNTEDAANLVMKIAWTETGTSTDETIRFQIRSASTSAGISSAAWCGYSEVSTSTCAGTEYFTSSHNGVSVGSNHPLRNGANDQYFQYKIFLNSGGGSTPTADNVTLTYVVNAPPNFDDTFGANGIDVSQIATSSDQNWGKVKIQYSIRDVDSESGSITSGYVTPTFSYTSNGGSTWNSISHNSLTFEAPTGGSVTDVNLDGLQDNAINASNTQYLIYTAYWDVSSVNAYSTNFNIRLTIDDNEAANNTAVVTSATSTLDAKDPVPGVVQMRIVATTTIPTIHLSAADDSEFNMKISTSSSMSTGSWETYSSTKSMTLDSDPETLYVQFRDVYGNITASSSATTPETPTSLMIQDTSNISANEYSLFIAWKMVAQPSPGFGKYHILRSTSSDVSTFSEIASTTDRSVNYYRDSNISSSTAYYYMVVTEDANSNVSYYSASVSGTGDGTQGPGEGGGGTDVIAPTISNVQVIATTTQTATIVWDTNELSNSTVGFSATAGLYPTEVGNSTMADTVSGVGRHQVVLTNLSASTTYYFQVKSTDPAGNTKTNDNSGNGYTFTTKQGAVISGVTQNAIQNTKATVVWTTDIQADSIVVYSTNSDLSAPQTVQGSPSLVTSHTVNLTDLTSNTRYYYYVRSTDAENNPATDTNGGNYYTFLTTQDTAAPTITFTPGTDITNVGTSTASIAWTTDQPATSTLAYGTTSGGPYGSRADISNYNYNHSVNLSGLSASTTYYFQLVATDENGNSTTTNNGGAGFNFTTDALPDETAPVISLVATSTTISSAIITWSTDENASSFVQYATGTAGFETDYIEKGRSATTTSHSVTLSGLSENVTYYFRVRSTDVDGNTRTDDNSGNYYSFTTTRDSTEPTISSISASPVTDTSAVITWTTSERATSQITFGTAVGTYSSSTAINTNLNLTHSITLSSLAAGTVYYYKVVSADASGNTATSTEQSLTTSETLSTETQVQAREATARANTSGGGVLLIDKNDRTAPIITNFQVQDIKADSAVITWNTNEEANSLVKYQSGNQEYSQFDPASLDAPGLSHTVKIPQLMPESIYSLQAISMDRSGNLTKSESQTFKTLSLAEEIKNEQSQAEEKEKDNILMATVNKTIELMNRIASQVSLGTMQTALMNQYNSIEDLANLIPAPILSGEPRVELTPTTAMIAWRTDKESNSLVAIAKEAEYDNNKTEPYTQTVGLPEDKVLNHAVTISDLEPDTVYHYQLRSKGPIGTVSKSADFIFRTPKKALEIGNYTVENVSPEKAIFKWVTNVETDSQIKYTPYRNNMLAVDETKLIKEKAFTTIHEVTVSEFEAGTVYQIEISSKDASGSIASKMIPTFFTSDIDLPPTISQVQTNLAISPGKDSKIQAVISWMTDEPSTSRVYYNKGFVASGTVFAEKTALDAGHVKKHAVVITKFEPGAIYTFKVESVDSNGNTTLSKTYTILAPKQKETVFQVIMKNFESMFGWVGNVKK